MLHVIAKVFIVFTVGIGAGLLTFGIAMPHPYYTVPGMPMPLHLSQEDHMRATFIGAGVGVLTSALMAFIFYVGSVIRRVRGTKVCAESARPSPFSDRPENVQA